MCVCHRLQNCLKHAVENIPALEKLLAKCRKVAGHFKHSALATDTLIKKQLALKMKKPLSIDCATRWNSAFYMLEQLVQLQVPLDDVIDEEGKPHLVLHM